MEWFKNKQIALFSRMVDFSASFCISIQNKVFQCLKCAKLKMELHQISVATFKYWLDKMQGLGYVKNGSANGKCNFRTTLIHDVIKYVLALTCTCNRPCQFDALDVELADCHRRS